jgi:hypothetical protein
MRSRFTLYALRFTLKRFALRYSIGGGSMLLTTTIATTSGGYVGGLTLMTTIVMVGLLIAKEVSSSLAGARAQRLSQALNVALIPLVIIFVSSLAARVLAAL